MSATETPKRKLRHDQVDTRVALGPLVLRNPIVTASGCFGNGREIQRFYDIAQLGAVVVKSITVEPRQGLPTPRMAETANGMLNAIGLQNSGIEAWLADELPWLNRHRVPVIASIAGKTTSEYRYLSERLRGQPGIVAIEANISCPNVEDRNIVFACREESTRDAVSQVTRVANVPVFAKLTPDVTDIVEIAETAMAAGATGVSMINTLLGMAIDVQTRRPKLAAVTGGLSGPAIKPVAVRAIHQVHQALPDVPIIGMGGVRTVEDVIELMLAGATAVAVGTANFANPMVALELAQALPRWCAERDIATVTELQGGVQL
jgi:dihydroorotate dehydrogenase (NAD+) catalytic subunit